MIWFDKLFHVILLPLLVHKVRIWFYGENEGKFRDVIMWNILTYLKQKIAFQVEMRSDNFFKPFWRVG